MSEPTFKPTTERMYARLPEGIRVADAAQDYALKRYLSALGDIESDVDQLIARFTYLSSDERKMVGVSEYTRPDNSAIDYSTSDLVNGNTADVAWLQWLAQLGGVNLKAMNSVNQWRSALASGVSGSRAGSLQALIAAVQDELTGTKRVTVHNFSTSAVDIGTATMWDVLIITRTTDTPDFATLVDHVIAKGAKPAGVVLHHITFETTWDNLEAGMPTWNDIDAATWNQVEDVGL